MGRMGVESSRNLLSVDDAGLSLVAAVLAGSMLSKSSIISCGIGEVLAASQVCTGAKKFNYSKIH